MTWYEACLLGIVQGLTEFLPISSSGHLVIAQQLFGLKASSEQLLGFDLALHFGTLLSVVAVFYKDIVQMFAGCARVVLRPTSQSLRRDDGAYLAFLIIVGTIPAAVIGIGFQDFFHGLFTSALGAGAMLLVTGTILWLTRWVRHSDRSLGQLSIGDAFLVGMAQAFAILPGISRSGATIATGLFRGWNRRLAARYSFLLALPAIAGGMLLELDNLQTWSAAALVPLSIGIVSSALSGFLAIHWLLRVVQRGNLSRFAYYCWALGLLTLAWFSLI